MPATASERLAKVLRDGLVAPYVGEPEMTPAGLGLHLLRLPSSGGLVAFSSEGALSRTLGVYARGFVLSFDEAGRSTFDGSFWIVDPGSEEPLVLDEALAQLLIATSP